MNRSTSVKILTVFAAITIILCCSAKAGFTQMTSLDNQMSVDIMKAVMQHKTYGIEYSKLRNYSPRISVIKGSLRDESGLGYLLRDTNKPSLISKNNPYVKITMEPIGNKSYERRLADKIMAAPGSGVLAPADVFGMALDVTNGDYPLAMLTTHNLLKEVTHAERDKFNKNCYLNTSLTGGIPSSHISSKLKNLRPVGDTYYNEKMGSWYHMYGMFFVGSSMSPGEAETLGGMENFMRKAKYLKEYISLFGGNSPHDPFKEGVNNWSSSLTYSLNRLANSGIYIPEDINSLTQTELETLRNQLTAYHRKLGEELEAWRKVSNSGVFGVNAEAQALAQKHQELVRAMQKALYQEVARIDSVTPPVTPRSAKLNLSIVFVVDASGSMSGSKLSAAKNAVRNTVSGLKTDLGVEMALFVFSGCGSCRMLQGFTQDPNAITSKLNFSAGGGTPIAYSLKKASNYLRQNGSGQKGKIILLSDGGESCNGKPVEAAKAIRTTSKIFDIK